MDIKSFLMDDVVYKVSDIDYMEKMLYSKEPPIRIIYGETFDDKGQPIDCLKYYLFMGNLVDVLKGEGIKTEAIVLVADTSVYRNEEGLGYKHAKNLGKNRIRFIETVKKLYNCDFEAVLMSDFIEGEKFINKFEEVRNISENNPIIMEMVGRSVPKDKLEQEKKSGFQYSFEEITLISGFDIKIGPPREELYDNVSREISKEMGYSELFSIYLTPTFPLTSNHNLDSLGLTPYKAGSKGFHDSRIIIGKTRLNRVFELIDSASVCYENNFSSPVFDMAIIGGMTKNRLDGNLENSLSSLKERSSGAIRNFAKETIFNNILKMFGER